MNFRCGNLEEANKYWLEEECNGITFKGIKSENNICEGINNIL